MIGIDHSDPASLSSLGPTQAAPPPPLLLLSLASSARLPPEFGAKGPTWTNDGGGWDSCLTFSRRSSWSLGKGSMGRRLAVRFLALVLPDPMSNDSDLSPLSLGLVARGVVLPEALAVVRCGTVVWRPLPSAATVRQQVWCGGECPTVHSSADGGGSVSSSRRILSALAGSVKDAGWIWFGARSWPFRHGHERGVGVLSPESSDFAVLWLTSMEGRRAGM